MVIITWAAIVFCITQSAMFSGLNLAYFSIPKLRLEIEAKHKNKQAIRILKLRNDSNFLLTTILWGNVGINVLLTLLTDSVLAGIAGFLFSTFAITIFGEIFPQAYFSRNALKMGYYLYPVLKFYQILLYPLAKLSALVLNKVLGQESIEYYKEKSLKELISKHTQSKDAKDIDIVEGIGAMNFLDLDDIKLESEGEPINPDSIIRLEFDHKKMLFPKFEQNTDDNFINKVQSSEEKWVIITDNTDTPRYVLDADGFLRSALLKKQSIDPLIFCHKPIITNNPEERLGNVIQKLEYKPEHINDNVVDNDVIILWGENEKRIITGADILGYLLKGITKIAK